LALPSNLRWVLKPVEGVQLEEVECFLKKCRDWKLIFSKFEIRYLFDFYEKNQRKNYGIKEIKNNDITTPEKQLVESEV